MLRIVYSAASKFKYVTQSLAKINDEGIFHFAHDQLAAQIMSPDKTTMAVLKMPPLSFDEYIVDEELALIVRTDEFNKVVRRATRNDDLIIEYDYDQQILLLSLRDRKTGLIRQFTITSTPATDFKLREPKIDSTARFHMLSDDFKTIIQDSKIVGDTVTFIAKPEEVIVKSEGEEKEYEWIMKEGDPLITLDVDEETTSTYTRTSLEVTSKPTGAADNVKVSYATDYPMQIEYTFPNGEKLVIYIAPSF